MPARTKLQIVEKRNSDVVNFGKEALEWNTPRHFEILYLLNKFGVKHRTYDNGIPRWIRAILKEDGVYLRKKNNTSMMEVYTDKTVEMR